MKTVIITLTMCLLCGCKEETFKTDPKTTVLKFSSGTGIVTYKVIQIDGVEYYASRTYGGNWIIGPKKENR